MGAFDRWFDVGARPGDEPDPAAASTRILTAANALSAARLLALPWIYLDLVGGRYLRALIVLAVFAATDWLDGYVARRFDQVTRLGQLLDPISDRALFLVVGIAFVVSGIMPLWAVLVLFVRDGLILVGGAVLLLQGIRPPAVTRLGKVATFGLMFALPFFLGAAVIGDGPADPDPILLTIAWITYAINAVVYWISAVGYVRAVLQPKDVG
jgi:cardiolipin synthase (CMP-forming)